MNFTDKHAKKKAGEKILTKREWEDGELKLRESLSELHKLCGLANRTKTTKFTRKKIAQLCWIMNS